MDATQECKGYIILIEWDGQKPPTRWYTTLAKYGLSISGDKDTSPLTRRAGTRGVTFQEGALIVNSESLARTLASTAREMGAKTVMVGNVEARNFQMSEADVKTMQNITAATSKRGPKSKQDEGRYIIHCFEEAKTCVADLREQPIVCPECGGIRIQWWRGDARRVQSYNPSMNIQDYWIATRFNSDGRYEIPMSYSNSKMPSMPAVKKLDPAGAQIELALEFSEKHPELDAKSLLRAMDVCYCSQQLPDEVRLTRRINALREYYGGGGSVNYPMAIDPHKLDMVDVAGSDSAFIKYL